MLSSSPSLRMQSVQTPIIPVIGELIRAHPGTISLGQGVVWYGPPPEANAHLAQFFADPQNNKYKPVEGIPQLVDAIAQKLKYENNIQISAHNRIVVTAGGNMGFVNALLAIADPGDDVILNTPFYFNHEMAIAMANCRAVLVATDDRYQLRPDAIRAAITSRTRAVVTISPNNPSGAVYPESVLREVNEICRNAGVYHISDEAYENFTYDAPHFSPGATLNSAPHTISLFSLSKAYGFASWRIGYMVIPSHLFDAVKKIQDTVLISPPVISQFAALGCLAAGSSYCREKFRGISEVRKLVLAELQTIRDICAVPSADGAFYCLVKIDTKLNAMTLAERLIKEHGVAVIPGTAFGMNDGCYLRLAYGALQKDTVAAGIGRFVRGILTIVGKQS